MNELHTRATWVGKAGGSLLETPDVADLGERLAAVVRERGGERPLLVVGGGPTVDLLRRWDRLFALGEEFSHWTAVRALALNARVIERIVPHARRVRDARGCERVWECGGLPILDCYAFLTGVDARRPDPLPRRWVVTSDSIAARVAAVYGARELTLLKSTSVPAGLDLAAAARQGLVDGYFPRAAALLEAVSLVNLRAHPPAVSRLAVPAATSLPAAPGADAPRA